MHIKKWILNYAWWNFKQNHWNGRCFDWAPRALGLPVGYSSIGACVMAYWHPFPSVNHFLGNLLLSSAWLFLSPVLTSVYPQRLCLFYLGITCITPTLGKGELWNFQKMAKVFPLFLPILFSPTHLMQRKRCSLVTTLSDLAALTHTDLYYNTDWLLWSNLL